MLARRLCSQRCLAPASQYLRSAAARSGPVMQRRCLQQHSQSEAASYYLLEYQYVPDIVEKRAPYRAAHLAGAQAKADEGHIVVAGAVGNPPAGAAFVFRNQTPEQITAFVEADPYVKAGLVTSWKVQPYTVVVKGSAI